MRVVNSTLIFLHQHQNPITDSGALGSCKQEPPAPPKKNLQGLTQPAPSATHTQPQNQHQAEPTTEPRQHLKTASQTQPKTKADGLQVGTIR